MITFAFLKRTPWNQLYHKDLSLGGLYNGYVAIRKDIYDKVFIDPVWKAYAEIKNLELYDYDNTKVPSDVHGGITFINTCSEPIEMSPLTDIPGDYINKYVVVGFDTGHWNDDATKWDYEAVKRETLQWKSAIDEAINNFKS